MFYGLSDPHPDPLLRGTDPRIRIRIPNIAKLVVLSMLYCSLGYTGGPLYPYRLPLEKMNRPWVLLWSLRKTR